jgi:hypothetical protein
MKFYLSLITKIIALVILFYGTGAFISASFDISLWSVVLKSIISVFFLGSVFCVTICE